MQLSIFLHNYFIEYKNWITFFQMLNIKKNWKFEKNTIEKD